MARRGKLLIVAGILELLVLIFALVISLRVWLTRVDSSTFYSMESVRVANIDANGPFIGFFQNNSTAFFLLICLPVLLIMVCDFIYLAIVAFKKGKDETEVIDEIKEQAKAEAKEKYKTLVY